MTPAQDQQQQPARASVLVIDIGGSRVKFKLGAETEKRRFESFDGMSAADMVAEVRQRTGDWPYDRVAIGYPGPVVGNCPLREPHNLDRGWAGFDFAAAFGCPARVVNDAVLQAVGSYEGGHMLFLGLGTGLGSAMILDGAIAPMELAHLPYKRKTYEHYVGSDAMKRTGKKKWREQVETVIGHFHRALQPDYIVLGGGNAEKLKVLPSYVRLGDNELSFVGGVRLWHDPRFRPVG